MQSYLHTVHEDHWSLRLGWYLSGDRLECMKMREVDSHSFSKERPLVSLHGHALVKWVALFALGCGGADTGTVTNPNSVDDVFHQDHDVTTSGAENSEKNHVSDLESSVSSDTPWTWVGGWRPVPEEHRADVHQLGAVARLHKHLVWLDLTHSDGLALLDEVSGPIAFKVDENVLASPTMQQELRTLNKTLEIGLCMRREFTNAGLSQLHGLTKLRMLSLRDTQVTDAGLASLQGLSHLRVLDLSFTQVTDAGLGYLRGLTKLQRLYCNSTSVSDTGLAHLRELTQLRWLNLFGTGVTDAGMMHIGELIELRELDLGGTKVTDAGLEHLRMLTELQMLNLNGTKVTDTGIAHLRGLNKLQMLYLGSTEVTESGRQKLSEDLPQLVIRYR